MCSCLIALLGPKCSNTKLLLRMGYAHSIAALRTTASTVCVWTHQNFPHNNVILSSTIKILSSCIVGPTLTRTSTDKVASSPDPPSQRGKGICYNTTSCPTQWRSHLACEMTNHSTVRVISSAVWSHVALIIYGICKHVVTYNWLCPSRVGWDVVL